VPKINLVSRLQALMHTGCLHMPDTLPLAKTFSCALQRRGQCDVRRARKGAHDDLILAVYGLDGSRVATVESLQFR